MTKFLVLQTSFLAWPKLLTEECMEQTNCPVLSEQLLNFGHGKLGGIMEMVIESHGILMLQRVQTLLCYVEVEVVAGLSLFFCTVKKTEMSYKQ